MKVKAKFYEQLKDKIHCYLCPHNCVIENGHHGKCNVRFHEDGVLLTINYGEVTSLALDPIEKKPLHYFRPHTQILSAGSFGCNFTCGFCQNYSISQHRAESSYMSPEQLIASAQALDNNIGIAFTYNEPTIWYEYVYDTAKLLKETDESKAVVLVTNGFISKEPLKELLPYVDAMNIDLKAFNTRYYDDVCGGSLRPVLDTIKLAAETCHIEITTLLVSGKNDNIKEVEDIARFLGDINRDIPLHLSRYFPRYKMDNPPTDIDFMYNAKETAEKFLNRVALGNV